MAEGAFAFLVAVRRSDAGLRELSAIAGERDTVGLRPCRETGSGRRRLRIVAGEQPHQAKRGGLRPKTVPDHPHPGLLYAGPQSGHRSRPPPLG